MSLHRVSRITSLTINLEANPASGQHAVAAQVTETIYNGEDQVGYPLQRTLVVIPPDVTDDLLTQLNAALQMAQLQLTRTETA